MPNRCLCDQLYIRVSVLVHSRAASSTSKRISFKSKRHVSLVICVSLFYKSQRSCYWGGPLGPWQVLLMNPKGRNASKDGFVNLKIPLNSIAFFASLAPSALALLFCFSLIRRSLSIVTTWSSQYNTCRLNSQSSSTED